MYQMTDQERAERSQIKALHQRIRLDMREASRSGGQDHRYLLLVWGFVRGLPYRRIERSHHVQIRDDGSRFEHNLPCHHRLTKALAEYLPEFQADMDGKWLARRGCRAEAWIANPDGAIPAPPPRAKRPCPPVAAE